MAAKVTPGSGRAPQRVWEQKEYDLGYELDGTSWSVRENLCDILRREILGPAGGEEERLLCSPVTKYLVGRIAPTQLGANADELIAETSDEVEALLEGDGFAGTGQDSSGDLEGLDMPPRSGFMIPASMGLRFQVPPDLPSFTVRCRWGTYEPDPDGEEGEEYNHNAYRRKQVEERVTVPLSELVPGRVVDRHVKGDVLLRLECREDGQAKRVVEVALVNDRGFSGKVPIPAWLFQTELEIEAGGGAWFLPVHDWAEDSEFKRERDQEQRRINLQYRDRLEFAVGRTCSADWDEVPGTRRASAVRTTWLPTAEVPQVEAVSVPDAVLDMEALAKADAAGIEAGLKPIVEAYASWLDGQEEIAKGLPEHLRETAMDAVDEARQVYDQLADGLSYLISHDEAVLCFNFMNRVMADQRVRSQVAALRAVRPGAADAALEDEVRSGKFPHHWRVFQLAFVLMQVRAVMEPSCPARSGDLARAQLIFFPTGGGKTEAYLGLAALTFAARRRQGRIQSPDGALECDGVAVIMRYTLRLLTSQQFQRAAALVCAAELERRRHPEAWGDEPFRLGLWVGSGVTPKRVDEAARQLKAVNERSSRRVDALQLHSCPWCGRELGPSDVTADEILGRVYVHCSDDTGECPFAQGGEVAEGLPVVSTDEEVYRLVPSFIIGTVDKFARLAREGEAASIFGYVGRKCDRHGYVPLLDDEGKSDYGSCAILDNGRHPSKHGRPVAYVHPCDRLRPPDLIIQDELHLITGALGTTVGLFEVAIDSLCTWRDADGARVRPLVVASSATVRNVADQVRGLYGRDVTVFPPQVVNASDTFFSKEVTPGPGSPGRRYVGVCSTGVRLTTAEVQTATVLMKGAQLLFDRTCDMPANPADPYMTLVGYFSATRELAGMARYMQDDVSTALRRLDPRSGFHRRTGTLFGELNIGELTSRISSNDIVSTLGRMASVFDRYYSTQALGERLEARNAGKAPAASRPGGEAPYDTVLATSMLQVGVDVPRLGLMMVVGQPKNTAEYIQASSRVGRDGSRPGLVVTLGNWARPRDLAHFEQFRAYHESFYAKVEPLSVTPFSTTSLERGAAGLLVSAVRVMDAHRQGGLNPDAAACKVVDAQGEVDVLIERVLLPRILAASDDASASFARGQLANRLCQWVDAVESARQEGSKLVYEKASESSGKKALLLSAEGLGPGDVKAFSVANSMREVQPEINILVSPDRERLLFKMSKAPAWSIQAGFESEGESEGERDGVDE